MKTEVYKCLFLLLLRSFATQAFLCPASFSSIKQSSPLSPEYFGELHVEVLPAGMRRQRKSVAAVQMAGLFGLGFGEIALVLVAVGFVLGPEQLGKMARGSASLASEYKEELSRVPEEFQKGMEEGETDARSRKARRVKSVPDSEK